MTLKDKVTSVVTGDAYDKPAQTKDGAMTTQDSPNAHTLKGTSADPNPPEPGKNKMEQLGDKAQEVGDKAQDKMDNTSAGQKAKEGDLSGAAQHGKEGAKEEANKRS